VDPRTGLDDLEKRKFLTLQGLELRPLGRPARSQSILTTRFLLLSDSAVSDERTAPSFTIAAGARHRSHSRVRVPRDSRRYFTVSDSKLPFPSPPMIPQGYGGGIRPRLHTGVSTLFYSVVLLL
jgi:hypothetical protein